MHFIRCCTALRQQGARPRAFRGLRVIYPGAPQGMPFKWFHGKTGIVWDVTKRAIGVEVLKPVRDQGYACKKLHTHRGSMGESSMQRERREEGGGLPA